MGKRKAVISSDSEDDNSPAKNKNVTNKKRDRVYLDSDSDESPKKVTRAKKSKKEESDVEILSDEDQLVLGSHEKSRKSGKKQLLPGQTTLNFGKKPEKSGDLPSTSTKKSAVSHVNPADFFKSSPRPPKEPKKKLPSPVKKISPSQKENTKKAGADDEFVDSDDSFESFVPEKVVKKAKTPEKVKKVEKTPEKKKTPEKAKKVEKVPEKEVKKTKTPEKVEKIAEKKKTPHVPKITSKDSGYESQEVQKIPKKPEILDSSLSWVDKYKPNNASQLVGQHGDKSPMNKLIDWLKKWAQNNLGEGGKTKKAKPPPFLAQTDGTAFKAALLSGSPGVGKTTCAYMACINLGFKVVEMNASDVRNKKHLEAKIGELTGSHQIEQYFGAKKSVPQDNSKVHHVLIMDEVDGMSGNEDRAGVSELIQIIKESKIPIICICNDRQHTKIRSLANHCFDIRFSKPRVEQIRARMMTICAMEKVKIQKDELDELIELSGHDVRQTIYNLQMRSKSKDGEGGAVNKKDVALGPFEAARKLLSSQSTLIEKQQMFFVDYGIMPLFVQENYLNMKNDKHSQLDAIRSLRKASDLISQGDNIDKHIRGMGAWKLLNEQSMIAAALPAQATQGHLKAMLQFPSWLGKNSTAGKRRRLLQQLIMHTHLKVSSSLHSFATDYAPILRSRITKPLLENEMDGIGKVIETMQEYDLIRDDQEALTELVTWPGKIDPASKILTKVKSALTRTLNKTARMLPYSMAEVSKGKRKGVNSIGIEMDEDGNLVEQFEDEDDDEEDENDQKEEKSTEVVVKVTTKGGGATGKSTRGGGGKRGGRGAKK